MHIVTLRATLVATLLLSACNIVKDVAETPGAIADAATGRGQEKQEEQPDPELQRAAAQRIADEILLQLRMSTREFAERAGTPEARQQALRWSLEPSTRALAIACGPRPGVALGDLLVLIEAHSLAHELHWGPKVWGEADEPMIACWRRLSAVGWHAAEGALTPKQYETLKQAIDAWRAQGGERVTGELATLPSMADLAPKSEARSRDEGLLGWFDFDPLEGLEPVARETARTRELIDRALYHAQRAPELLALQIESMTWNLTQQPSVDQVLADVSRVSKAVEALPEVLRAEREGLVTSLEKAGGPLQELLVEARGTLEAGTALAAAVDGAMKTIDGMGDEPETRPEPVAPGAPPGRPFDVVEYGAAAERFALLARELTTTVATLDRSLPEVRVALDETAQRVDRSVERAIGATRRTALLVVAAAAVAVLLVKLAWAGIARRIAAATS